MADDSAQREQSATDSTSLNDIATNGALLNQNVSALINAVESLENITLPVSKGGTGQNSLTAHSVLIGNGVDPINFAPPTSNSGAAFIGVGASADPIFGKVILTQPATLATLTIANNKTLTANNSLTLAGTDGKTLTVSNSLGLAGTDSTTMTFPTSNANIAALNLSDQTLSGGANVTSKSLTTGSVTIDCGACPLQYITNGGAFTITAPANDGSCILKITNSASAGNVSFSGFTVGASTGDQLDTVNGHIFFVTIVRIGGTATYLIKAAQ